MLNLKKLSKLYRLQFGFLLLLVISVSSCLYQYGALEIAFFDNFRSFHYLEEDFLLSKYSEVALTLTTSFIYFFLIFPYAIYTLCVLYRLLRDNGGYLLGFVFVLAFLMVFFLYLIFFFASLRIFNVEFVNMLFNIWVSLFSICYAFITIVILKNKEHKEWKLHLIVNTLYFLYQMWIILFFYNYIYAL